MPATKTTPSKIKPARNKGVQPKTKKRFRMPVPKVPVVNQKAIDVAKDVLKQLEYTKFQRGLYFDGYFKANIDEDAQFSEVVETARKSCKVCLLGACVLAKARVLDHMTCGDVLRSNWADSTKWCISTNTYGQLRGVFGKKQCELMESVFEQVGEGEEYGKSIRSNKERVRAVMVNLIRNGGVFILPEKKGAKR